MKVGPPVLIKNRYEVKDVLGRGGMGVVYKAFDALMRREVAVKTLRDVASSLFVDLFYRECNVLSAMVHPNIVEIFDMGEFEEDGVMKPYFVMPLLPGKTLYDLVYPNNGPGDRPLPVEQCTDIISQACRGLHAAHECGLLHRDIKPRNIFVMRDNSVKLIDFGVVRLLGHQTIGAAGTLGTLHYMAPEQISMKELTARSDIFSLATVCYEAMTGVHPFIRENDAETAAAVAEHTPALVNALNPMVNLALAQAVAQGMAKDPRNRFESAAAFADALQRGLRNEKAGSHLLTNPQNRLARAQRSFARGDYEFAQEIVEQLEAEGIAGPEVEGLRRELTEAVRKRQAEVQLSTARRYFDEEEYVLALRRVSEILESNGSNQPALALKKQIEERLNNLQVADSLKRAAAHLDNGAFTEARRLIDDSLELQPGNEEAQRLLKEADQRALDWPRQRQEQEGLFQSAQSAYFEGRFDTSLRTLEELAELTKKSKAAGGRVNEYKDFYKRVRGDYDALQAMLADARKLLANGDLESAYLLSERLREQCAQDPDVLTLSKDISARRDAREEDYRRGIARSIENEPDLSSRLHILNQAARARPSDEYFHAERQKLQAQLQRVTELVQRAQVYEEADQYEYAIEEWLCVKDFYPAYPGLEEQLNRVKEIWKAAREKAMGELSAGVNEALKEGDLQRAGELLAAAQSEFQGEAEYVALQTLFQSRAAAHRAAGTLLSRIGKAESERRFGDIPALAKSVAALSQNVEPLRRKSFDALNSAAARLVGSDWRVAELVLKEAAKIGTVPDTVQGAIARQQREEEVTGILGAEGNSQSNLDSYRERVGDMLRKYPDETRLEERLRSIDATLADKRRQQAKKACARELKVLEEELSQANDHRQLWETYIRAKNVAAPFADDHEIAQLVESVREQGSRFEEAAEALTRDRIRDCYAICDGMLARWPGHLLFQNLRERADARHRQLGEEYLARVERWLASEPDIYQRELIIKRAQEEYPFEKRYAEELLNLERERAVAETLASKARDFEKRGQTAEALAQWRQVRNIHPAYPGLEESITRCETLIAKAQRKARAQGLVSQGEFHLADGHFAEGVQMLREASEMCDDIPDLLRQAAPHLVAAAGNVLPSSPKLAESMLDLARRLDDDLQVPKEMRAKISDACKAEDLSECLTAIQTQREARELAGAVAVAEKFLDKYPGVKQVESARARVAAEFEEQRKQQARAQTLDDLGAMERRAADLGPRALSQLRQDLQEAADLYPGDKEINQRASSLDAFFSALAEVRSLLQEHAPEKVDEACARAMVKFPGHPLFKEALDESAQLKAEAAAQETDQVRQRVGAESDFNKQAAIVREALFRFPGHSDLLDEQAAIGAKQRALKERIERARTFDAKHLFGEAIKEWEAIGKDYPWVEGVAGEVERLAEARRKEKSGASDRWLRQVEEAIETCDYENAATMLRQAAQQQPDRKLQGLQAKLTEGLKKKHESDAKLNEGRTLFADGDLEAGGKALYRAFELQPKDQEKTNAIVLLLLGQIRAHMNSEPAICESLLAHLKNIRPDQILPLDIREAFAKRAASAKAKPVVSEKAAEAAKPAKVRKIDLAQERSEKTLTERPSRPPYPGEDLSLGKIAAALIVLVCLADAVFFLAPPANRGVPVQISVTPDHTMIDLDGQVCVMPDCKFKLLKPGEHHVKFRKDGYKGKDAVVTVKETDSTPLNLTAALEPLPVSPAAGTPLALVPVVHSSAGGSGAQAKIQIRGALPRTRVRLDGSQIGEVTKDGTFTFAVPPGPHTVDLSLDGFSNRTITRNFARGESVSLAKDEVQLQPRQPEVQR
jgi:serine/threonine-protein kinase